MAGGDFELVESLVRTDVDVAMRGPAFDALSAAQQRLVAMWHLEVEVFNGGFFQFYFNGRGWLAPYAAEGYEMIGAAPFAAIVHQAIGIVTRECSDSERGARTPITSTRGTAPFEVYRTLRSRSELPSLDDLWYALARAHDLTALKAAYARANLEALGSRDACAE